MTTKNLRGLGRVEEDERLVVEPKPRPHYTIAELLAASDYSSPNEDRAWIDAPAMGREML